ncbi:hypothetical protein CC78DRAFT_613471 [Lojkania enalia]|uniref:Uncharacterized protein n=1 Tax=Lojkania enalia TaxID=147567 RepID=A0A9P4KI51_9PLEO|nr:hypothetical protein CC78DRAFT_613471 [Didymosphaeria enalia]
MHEISVKVEDAVYSEKVLQEGLDLDPATSDTEIKFKHLPSCKSRPELDVCSKGALQPMNVSINASQGKSILLSLGTILESGNFTTIESAIKADQSKASKITQMLYHSPNLTASMEGMVRSMNIALRAHETLLGRQGLLDDDPAKYINNVAPNHAVRGVMYIEILMARVGLWKDSPLAILMHTDWRPEAVSMGAMTVEEIDKLSEGLKARITSSEEDAGMGWKRRVVISGMEGHYLTNLKENSKMNALYEGGIELTEGMRSK